MTKANMEYELARQRYAALGVDTDRAISELKEVPLSLHCWQGDDVAGFETPDASLGSGGIQVTGNYPGRARTPQELRSDLEQCLSLVPGIHRVNLHAIYGEFGGRPVPRDEVSTDHFQGWVDWVRDKKLGLDFNCTCFSHPMAAAGYTLASRDETVRSFWVRHVKRCREIGAWMGEKLKSPCTHNLWIPDGSKDETVYRMKHRQVLRQSLDEVFETDFPANQLADSVESKLFGIGSESFVAGSLEFYLGYVSTSLARDRRVMVCLDMGHFHPTESVAGKVSAILSFQDRLLLHVSRGVRWDSDHVAVFDDATRHLFQEIVRAGALSRTRVALDFFDASINRVAAWVIGARATRKAILHSLLEPLGKLREAEDAGDLADRLALLEQTRTLPLGAVWDRFCDECGVPPSGAWMDAVRGYEKEVLSKRS